MWNLATKRQIGGSTVQVVSRHQNLETEFQGEVHVRYIFCVLELLVVVEVFADFLQHQAAVAFVRMQLKSERSHLLDIIKAAGVCFRFEKAVCTKSVVQLDRQGNVMHTFRVEHSLDCI